MRIGLLLPYSGPAGVWRLGGQACAMLAATERSYGPPVDLISMDCGETPETAAAAAHALRERHGVQIVVGMQPSHQRNAITRTLAGEVAYIYTPQYEGGWCGPSAIPLGVTDAEAAAPSIEWLARKRRISRWFFIGNDYLWPRAAYSVVAGAVESVGGSIVGSSFVSFGDGDYDVALSRIRRSRADGVIVVLLGHESVRFHRAFAAAGLPRQAARFSLGCDETLLWALDGDQAEGLYACQPYFTTAADTGREEMLDAYSALYGDAKPPVTSMTMELYDGVRLARAIGRAGGGDRATMASIVAGGFDRAAALSVLKISPSTDIHMPLRIGEADGSTFRSEILA